MEPTEAHLRDRIELHATFALDQVQVGPNLPIDLFPGNTVGFSDKSYEFLKIPVFINYMLCSHLAVRIDKTGTFTAREYLALFLGEEFITICALVEVILLFLK